VPKDNKLPPDVVRLWPEIFRDVEIRAVPVEYIESLQVHFKDGKVWEIDLDEKKLSQEGLTESLEDTLDAFFEEYDEDIINVDFRLNTRKVIADVKSRTRSFMKKRK
jgi:uncharacterized protein related to proFAR isomerase